MSCYYNEKPGALFLFPQSICHDINRSDIKANSLFTVCSTASHCKRYSQRQLMLRRFKTNHCFMVWTVSHWSVNLKFMDVLLRDRCFQWQVGVDRLSAWPIIGADIKHFTDYRYRPFSKHICRYFFFIIFFFFFFYNANKHTIYRWHYLLVNK